MRGGRLRPPLDPLRPPLRLALPRPLLAVPGWRLPPAVRGRAGRHFHRSRLGPPLQPPRGLDPPPRLVRALPPLDTPWGGGAAPPRVPPLRSHWPPRGVRLRPRPERHRRRRRRHLPRVDWPVPAGGGDGAGGLAGGRPGARGRVAERGAAPAGGRQLSAGVRGRHAGAAGGGGGARRVSRGAASGGGGGRGPRPRGVSRGERGRTTGGRASHPR
eukprot:1193066-Prorocentrum_minimum.AAC.1